MKFWNKKRLEAANAKYKKRVNDIDKKHQEEMEAIKRAHEARVLEIKTKRVLAEAELILKEES